MGGFQPVRINPPQQTDLLGSVGKLMQLRQMQQQAQAAPVELQRQQEALKSEQMQNQQQQRDMEDQQKIRDAFMQAGGDMDRTIDLAAKSGVQPKTIFALKAQYLDQKTKLATLDKDTLANHAKQAELVGGTAQSILALPPEQRLPAAQQSIQSFAQQGILPPDQAQQLLQGLPQDPAQLEQFLKLHALAGMSSKDQLDTELKKRSTAAQEMTAQARATAAGKPTEASLANQVAGGDPQKALNILAEQKRAGRANVNIMTPNDAKDIAEAIKNGDQPPTLQGLYRNAGPVRAELARQGVPLAKMETDWKATQRFMASANSTQQLRLQQSISSASDLLPKLEQLYSEWKQLAPVSGFKVANHAALVAMKNLPGRAGAVAMALDTQIAELTADLGNIYMGGNSPTDQALKLGAKALSSEWGPEAFEEGIKQAKLNIGIRANSMRHAAPVGLSGTTNYAPQAQPEAPAQGGGDFFSKFGGTKR